MTRETTKEDCIMRMFQKVTALAVTALALYGCGGGGGDGGGGTIDDSYVFPAGAATITFSAMSTAQLPASVSGIDLTLTLPQGMSVTTTGGTSGQIATASVVPGSALTGTNLAFGSYSAASRKTHLSMVTTSDSYRQGEFLRLTCTVASNSGITLGSLKSGSPVTVVKAVGYNSATSSTVVLTGKLKVNLGAVK